MKTENFISIQQICTHYKIPKSFISALHDYELIEIFLVQNTACIDVTQIKNIEKMMRLHYELDINFEGMDAIFNLLKKVESLNNDIVELYNKLERFDS
ncbi:MAG: chaperone modulator CbpM [Algibacter sp.]|uniref:chaperone modulator CbpM n=1 Tax=Algibacter sp. TaxID=1872428 RepID=UPI0026223D66|nr:chaperone modulator CbpM [Algibacter sp.]MDG1730367.1 chaperone modulator CbpM [Algibacter sp.]MDG2178845.1 chaperone modulator CbpM [Algibacter sp.]